MNAPLETSFREEKEPEMEDTSTLDSMLTTNEQPLSDLEDDITYVRPQEQYVGACFFISSEYKAVDRWMITWPAYFN